MNRIKAYRDIQMAGFWGRGVTSAVCSLMFVLLSLSGRAQQDPMYTQYMNNILSINPAYASLGTSLEVMVISRNQWIGIDGAPITQALSAQYPMRNFDTGIGLSFLSDEIGPVHQTGVYFDYSRKLRVGYRSYVSLGLKAGVNFYSTDYSILEYNDSGDPLLGDDVIRKFLPNFGVGTFFYNERLFLGLSAPKLLRNQITDVGYSSQFASKEEIHLFLISGYVFDINRDVKFKPYTLVKYVGSAPISVDLSAHFLFYDRLWLGANWRIGDAVGATLQAFVTKQFKVGYAYDVTATDLNSFNRGTHEVFLSFAFNLGRRRFMSPRYF
ncbi:type IX secretion system membrane protein PorP/SprF [Mangrovibacterium sp.]|uniref:PorP/SprF family type IX secretion system membrane protein n=1 Tax=Mangrovibacterium sp. TaxID=1961364 RepID=UPI003569D61C